MIVVVLFNTKKNYLKIAEISWNSKMHKESCLSPKQKMMLKLLLSPNES